MRVSDSFICFILSTVSHDVYHAAMLLWIYKGHPKFCGGLPSAVFSYMRLFENPMNDWMIYFTLRLFGFKTKLKFEETPGNSPLSLCVPSSPGQVLHGAQSVAHCLRLCQHRNDVSVFLMDATHAGCKPPRGRSPGERSRAKGGKSRAKNTEVRVERRACATCPSICVRVCAHAYLRLWVNNWDGSAKLVVTVKAEVLSALSGTKPPQRIIEPIRVSCCHHFLHSLQLMNTLTLFFN